MPPADVPQLPVNLREVRRRRGKSLRVMAAEIGVTYRVLLSAEQGRPPLPANQLAIATAYGLDLVIQWPDPSDQEP